MKTKNRGVLLYAINNGIDYVKLARFCAERIRQHWRLPVALVTNVPGVQGFDYVMTVATPTDPNARMYPDFKRIMAFYNHDRMMAIKHTPFEETIVVDTDYVVVNDLLPRLWDDQPLLVPSSAHSVSRHLLPNGLLRIADGSVQMCWATIVMFNKFAPETQRFFLEWQKSRVDYLHYAYLYGYDYTLYRNDHGVTIALQKLTGGVQVNNFILPYSIPTAVPEVEVTRANPLELAGIGKMFHDVHVMNKRSLLEHL